MIRCKKNNIVARLDVPLEKDRFANIVIPPLATEYTYYIGDLTLEVGQRVIVPLGNRDASGFVVSTSNLEPVHKNIKLIKKLEDPTSCFHSEDLKFFRWISEYYQEPLGNVLDVVTPTFHKIKKVKHYKLIIDPQKIADSLKSKNQRAILELFKDTSSKLKHDEILKSIPSASSTLKILLSKKLISLSEEDIEEPIIQLKDWAKKSVTLNVEQQLAFQSITNNIDDNLHSTFLLHGITGSGKTEVYIESIIHSLKNNKGALVIVPEIALTPQLVYRFQARLGKEVAVLHSGLSGKQRWENWKALSKGEKRVAVGARSALFAPVKNLGLIIVDEEHDSSFKQQDGLRYNARDLAIVKGKQFCAPVVLGSATPSLETFNKAINSQIKYLKLTSRNLIGSKIFIEIVDMNRLKPWELPSKHISPQLQLEISNALTNKEQIFLLYNRRGFASYVQCEKCEQVISCPHCSVTLTYHQKEHILVCHYCNFRRSIPTFCPSCSVDPKTPPGQLSLRGSGTEQTEDEVRRLFPEARVLRLDRDIANNLSIYEDILSKLRSHECDILVGTQMIAKGHDLPNVTLAAVIDCDVGLHMPDFRSAERVFQLLSQLAGRAGRGDKAGKVILQTRVPKHVSIACAAMQNFERFAKHELESRKSFSYPPFSRLLRIIISSKEEADVPSHARLVERLVRSFIETTKSPLQILGPTPCPLERIKTEWRWHLLIKSPNPVHLVKLITSAKQGLKKYKNIKIIYDLDPQDML